MAASERYGKRWNEDEMGAALDAYFQMLESQRLGKKVDYDAAVGTLLDGSLKGRTAEAVRRRFCNIGTLFAENGWPQVAGFEQRSHIGASQRKVIVELIERRGYRG